MAMTRYQVLCRYVNTDKNTSITNITKMKYEPTEEFYTDPDHKIFSGTEAEIKEEMDRQQELVLEASNGSNPKNDMLFVYKGTTRMYHKKWVEAQTGYVVRDWGAIKSKIGKLEDSQAEFYCINGDSPESGGIVVCKEKVMLEYFKKEHNKKLNFHLPNGHYTYNQVKELLKNSTIFQLTSNISSLMTPGYNAAAYYDKPPHRAQCIGGVWHQNMAQGYRYTIYDANIIIDDVTLPCVVNFTGYKHTGNCHEGSPYTSTQPSYIAKGYTSIGENQMFESIGYEAADIQTAIIPAHYEEVATGAYAIKDRYERIESSPWVINSTTDSLESALIKAEQLVEAIGLENVKVIKLVPLDQFVKIKNQRRRA